MGPLSYSSSAFKSGRSIYANKFSRTGIVGRTALATTSVAFTKYTRAQRLQGRGSSSERVASSSDSHATESDSDASDDDSDSSSIMSFEYEDSIEDEDAVVAAMLLTRPVRGDAEVPVLSKAAFSVGATEALPSGSAQDVVSEDGTDEPGTEDAHFDNIIVQRDSTGTFLAELRVRVAATGEHKIFNTGAFGFKSKIAALLFVLFLARRLGLVLHFRNGTVANLVKCSLRKAGQYLMRYATVVRGRIIPLKQLAVDTAMRTTFEEWWELGSRFVDPARRPALAQEVVQRVARGVPEILLGPELEARLWMDFDLCKAWDPDSPILQAFEAIFRADAADHPAHRGGNAEIDDVIMA